MSRLRHSTVTNSPDGTHHLARSLAKQLRPGDTVLLKGEVGAGKTHFARGAILALLEEPEDVPSPTYTLVQSYVGLSGDVWHADLYRVGDISEVEELGLTVAFSEAICFVEWPDRLGALTPETALTLELSYAGEDKRNLTFSWNDPKWTSKLEEVINGGS